MYSEQPVEHMSELDSVQYIAVRPCAVRFEGFRVHAQELGRTSKH